MGINNYVKDWQPNWDYSIKRATAKILGKIKKTKAGGIELIGLPWMPDNEIWAVTEHDMVRIVQTAPVLQDK